MPFPFSLSSIRKLIQPAQHSTGAPQTVEPTIPLKGWREGGVSTVDRLSDKELTELNEMLDWRAFITDSSGRRFGNRSSARKRSEPQEIPDYRVVLMNECFGLSDRHVIEAGCFEGIHTIALCQYAERVSAFDSRISNVVKTIVRCGLFGQHPNVFTLDCDSPSSDASLMASDCMFHVGVLYHLANPVEHLLSVGEHVRDGLLLDTHYATDDQATEVYQESGETYRFFRYKEGGYSDPFSGMTEFARWLTLEDLIKALKASGFSQVDIIERRSERNGERVLLTAKRK